ncbi:MAG TPA: metal-dependent hydrolase [Planctomycetota bacterium]|nr:metal-dependent hydrolase [Planctomycetota bacterium]
MADLLVHFGTAWLPARGLRDGRLRAILYVGVCLPDLLYKGILYLGNSPTWLCEPTHSPLGLLPFCYVGALLFEEAWRKRAFAALVAGGWLHLLLDGAKNFMGFGGIPWAFPFSMRTAALGWYAPEDSVWLMLPTLALMGIAEAFSRLSGRRPASP